MPEPVQTSVFKECLLLLYDCEDDSHIGIQYCRYLRLMNVMTCKLWEKTYQTKVLHTDHLISETGQ